jgi:hypothetical protein
MTTIGQSESTADAPGILDETDLVHTHETFAGGHDSVITCQG